jgi:hypothetical protein
MMTKKELEAIMELIRFADEYGHATQQEAIVIVEDYINGLHSTGSLNNVGD